MNRSGMVGGNITKQQTSIQQKPQQTYPTHSSEHQQQSSGILSTASNLLSGANTGSLFGNRQNNTKGPQVTSQTGSSTSQQQQHQINSEKYFNIINISRLVLTESR